MGVAIPGGRAATLTGQTGQAYLFEGDATHTTVRAAAGESDLNIRTVFWDPHTPYRADHEVCMIWENPATTLARPFPQPGLALRITPSGSNGGVRAVTVTQNVFNNAIWFAWVNTWDTSVRAAPDPVAHFDLFPIVNIDSQTMHSPWHVCGRISGDRVALKVWLDDDGPEPSWNDRGHVFTTRLPAGWDTPGYAGGYIGHLHPDGVASFSDIEVDRDR